jgi:hypothetical protein
VATTLDHETSSLIVGARISPLRVSPASIVGR